MLIAFIFFYFITSFVWFIVLTFPKYCSIFYLSFSDNQFWFSLFLSSFFFCKFIHTKCPIRSFLSFLYLHSFIFRCNALKLRNRCLQWLMEKKKTLVHKICFSACSISLEWFPRMSRFSQIILLFYRFRSNSILWVRPRKRRMLHLVLFIIILV